MSHVYVALCFFPCCEWNLTVVHLPVVEVILFMFRTKKCQSAAKPAAVARLQEHIALDDDTAYIRTRGLDTVKSHYRQHKL